MAHPVIKQRIHLISNAHLDPVWQWEWEEGLAEALSTFRIAADFCEQTDGFVFNHNESLLYRWVEEYDPPLFARIQALVAAGQWHIMGGWYLQPDCVMPSGESIVRQIETGRQYFEEKFGVRPTTAVNVDSFGHDRGLVQILVKAGYDSYLIGRPGVAACGVPAADFLWTGYDGSEIAVHLADEGYNSLMGKAVEKIRNYRDRHAQGESLLVMWGIGNHGGGPSRVDLDRIAALRGEWAAEDIALLHSTPEAYFEEVDRASLPRVAADLTPVMVGCYTSQVRVKQLHRRLEGMLWQTEKMVAAAELQTGAVIDRNAIAAAQETLLFNQFHDILPGSSIRRAEEAALYALGGALDSLKKQRMRAFMALAVTRKPPVLEPGDIPLYIYNPHPHTLRRIVECEFQLQDQGWGDTRTYYDVYDGDRLVPSQLVKEDSNIPLDWRKKLAVEAVLPPFAMTVLRCRPKSAPRFHPFPLPTADIVLEGDGARAVVDVHTGLLKDYAVGGVRMLADQACRLLVLRDDEDPWGMRVDRYSDVCGEFRLADADQAGRLAGLPHPLAPVRIVERGDVMTVVEAVFVHEQSHAVVRYTLGAAQRALVVDVRLVWVQPNHMVKLELPFARQDAVCAGQGMFGHRALYDDGRENVSQQWQAVCGGGHALTVINTGTYGSDFNQSVLRPTLLRSPAYCAHPIEGRQILPADRCLPRIDTGEREFRFVLEGGDCGERLAHIAVQAQAEHEQPMALSVFTGGSDIKQEAFILDNPAVMLSSVTRQDGAYHLRLFNTTETPQRSELTIKENTLSLSLAPFEIQSICFDGQSAAVRAER